MRVYADEFALVAALVSKLNKAFWAKTPEAVLDSMLLNAHEPWDRDTCIRSTGGYGLIAHRNSEGEVVSVSPFVESYLIAEYLGFDEEKELSLLETQVPIRKSAYAPV